MRITVVGAVLIAVAIILAIVLIQYLGEKPNQGPPQIEN
jgi:hypothetical protein